MSKNTLRLFAVIACFTVIPNALIGPASADDPEKEKGTYYTYSEMGITEKKLEGTKLKLTFKSKADKEFWCPGAKVKQTDVAVVVEFVRSSMMKNGSFDVKAKIGKNLTQSIEIDTRGMDVYVRDGAKQFKRIVEFAKAEQPATIKKSSNVQRVEPKPAVTPKTNQWIINSIGNGSR